MIAVNAHVAGPMKKKIILRRMRRPIMGVKVRIKNLQIVTYRIYNQLMQQFRAA